MKGDGWHGDRVRAARARIAALLPLPCQRCGLDVTPDMAWHVGHIVDRALGGGHDAANLGPEHARCSTSAGGKLAARLKRARAYPDKRIREW